MRQPSSVHHKRIPMGCDQQGRYPEAREPDGDYPCKIALIIGLSMATAMTLLALIL